MRRLGALKLLAGGFRLQAPIGEPAILGEGADGEDVLDESGNVVEKGLGKSTAATRKWATNTR